MPTKKDPSDRASTPSGRQQVNFRIDGELLERIDSTADSVGISRSELFLRAASIICDRPDLLLKQPQDLPDIKMLMRDELRELLDAELDNFKEEIMGKCAA
ncbi:ribbon-helix-helix protein, CopG family [Oscillatoria acuminata]|uniref:Ribbon-helix-helix protein, copG family n=1 Tax=Oscillatoria acuminata PCC 6304 TaxID=56110 RepID=K9TTY2_9CYAN|nr:ribbon-helix-helix protein, CopG family [Oscillatoria acuminata]AFY85474.1 hypothetical protein Oscil6304_6014 [Oscillatoria acuminata PCC 6304]